MRRETDFPQSRSLNDLSFEEAQEILAAAKALRAELAVRIAEASEQDFQGVTDTTEI